MKATRIVNFFLASLFVLIQTFVQVNGQTYSFRNYGAESNIPNRFVYTIDQSADGFLWIGTGTGFSRFNGFDFFNVAWPDSAAGRNPSVSYRDKSGKLWFGNSDGSLFIAGINKLITVSINNNRRISQIMEGNDGNIWIVPQGDTIFRIDSKNYSSVTKFALDDDQVIVSAAMVPDGRIIAGTQENVTIYERDGNAFRAVKTIEGFEYASIKAILPLDDTHFIAGTDGNGLFSFNIKTLQVLPLRNEAFPELNTLRVQAVTRDDKGELWVSTFGNGALNIRLNASDDKIEAVNTYNIATGLASNDVTRVIQDLEGNYWISFFGEGLSMLTSLSFSHFSPGKSENENNVIYINGIGDKYFLGTPSGFHIFDLKNNGQRTFTSLGDKTGNVEITAYCLIPDGSMFIGTAGNGLYLRARDGSVRKFFRSGDSGADNIRDILAGDSYIWLATTNGLILIDKKTGEELRRFDINNGLPHNSIRKLSSDSKGNILVATESDRIYRISPDMTVLQDNIDIFGNNRILSVLEDKTGTIWAASEGNGVFRCQNDSVFALTRAINLMSNYCYSIFADSGGRIWIGHDKGFSVYDSKSGRINVYGQDYAGNGRCNPSAVYESADGKVLIGTTEGVVVYDPKLEREKKLAPLTSINYITINDVPYDYSPSITLPYSRKYSVRIHYSGISFSAPEKVEYSTFLENYNVGWTKYDPARSVLYSLGDGKYNFSLVAVSGDGVEQANPVSFELIIKHPFWKAWWFIILCFVALFGVLGFIVRQREKAQKKIQEYLESELDARTSVIRQQKSEIELQNIEITDSINYAKRIQTSILPDINRLREVFPGAYILFHPRDIVSGDFYWFDRLDDERYMVVCADSTGHGVPGAFMSMIGSTLLQDIVIRQGVTKPSAILKMLDRQIFTTLNQNSELEAANDGMDMVICEINIRTRRVLFASAMRPIIMVLGGESYYIRGNRLSVGGETVYEKFYDDQEYFLKEGDTLYFFSDGLPDQFGGPDGKKLKIARLKKLVEDMSILPMDEQENEMEKFFVEWKGSYDQVDDIIFMAIRV